MADLTYEVSFKGVASPTLRAAFADHDLSVGSGLTLVRSRASPICPVCCRGSRSSASSCSTCG